MHPQCTTQPTAGEIITVHQENLQRPEFASEGRVVYPQREVA
jgi:hypothetical protein